MAFPSALDSFTSPAGTSLLTSPDHASLHATAGSAIVNIETNIGTNSGTSILKNFVINDFAVRINSSNVLQQPLTGTLGMSAGTISGQITNSGTVANGVYGTAQITGGTIGSASVLQPLNSAFWAYPGTAAQTLGTNQDTQITWGSVGYDLLSEFGTSTNNFIAKQAGIYQFTALIPITGGGASIQVRMRLNGTLQQAVVQNPTAVTMWNIFWQGSVPVGGTVDIMAFNNSTIALGTLVTSQETASFYGKRVF